MKLPFMRHFLNSIKLPDLIQSVDAWGETSVETEDLTFYNCSEGKIVEKLSEVLPNIGIAILAKTFIIETISKIKVRTSSIHTLK